MGKWFEDKLERKNLRKYTKKRMQGESKIVGISRKFSVTAWMIILNIVMYFVIIFSLVSFDEGKVMGIFALQANSFFQGNYCQYILPVWPTEPCQQHPNNYLSLHH